MRRLVLLGCAIILGGWIKHSNSQLPYVPTTDFSATTYRGTGVIVPPEPPPYALGDEGAFRFECNPSHLNWDDPIVAPGVQGGSHHLHMYFGAKLANYSSSYDTLRASGNGGTCAGGPLNRTGYWFPALMKPNQTVNSPPIPINSDPQLGAVVIRPDFITMYYKTDRSDQRPQVYTTPTWRTTLRGQELPIGLRWVSGFNLDTGTGSGVFQWGCEDGTGGGTIYDTLADVAAATDCLGTTVGCPACNPGQDWIQTFGYQPRVEVRGSPAQCWNGTQLDTANHRDHMTFRLGAGLGCPATHPILTPGLTYIIWFSHQGPSDFSLWYLSSDKTPGHTQYPGGTSFHTDWFGAWDVPDASHVWAFNCDGLGNDDPMGIKSCSAGEMGDPTGMILLESGMSPTGPGGGGSVVSTTPRPVPERFWPTPSKGAGSYDNPGYQ